MSNEVRSYRKIVRKVRAIQKKIEGFSDLRIASFTETFRMRLKQGETLNHLLPEAFAVMCEADRRILGKNPYDVQILGAIALHKGQLAEIGTGEGKTLTATLALYLNALEGKGAFLVTTNEYLAIRDFTEMSRVYRFMGLTAGTSVVKDPSVKLTNSQKKKIYESDIVYTTHGVLGFDYLFNNLVSSAEERFLRPFHYIIIDEADSVLLDSAQTPLVISGSPRVQSNLYQLADTFISTLRESIDYELEDESVWLTREGIRQAEQFFQIENFYDEAYFEINRHVMLALRAHMLFQKGKDYTVSGRGELTLLDTGTGRMMPGVKLRGGQHQALEVKEGLPDSTETRSVASVTYQNLFLLFEKMSGMSGTILENRKELEKIYKTKVLAIPPNKPVIRRDLPDVFLPTVELKFQKAVAKALEAHRNGRPVLIVAATIEETERISQSLIRHGIAHNVLNANNAYWEASIISEAGQKNAVTVATAMAGRGTDIKLGKTVENLGGLTVIGVGCMANKRIERQVRGRAGRQGDPGSSQFFVSLQDEIVLRNQAGKVEKLEKKKRLSGRKLKRVISRAQMIEEENAAHARENAMDYDRVMKKQRNLIYKMRNRLLDGGTFPYELFLKISRENIRAFVRNEKKLDRFTINRYLLDNISFQVSAKEDQIRSYRKKQVRRFLMKQVMDSLQCQTQRIGNDKMAESFMRLALLNTIDEAWVDQVDYLHQLQSAVSGRTFAQRNVVDEFQNEAFQAYCNMERNMKLKLMRTVLLSNVSVDGESKLHIIFR